MKPTLKLLWQWDNDFCNPDEHITLQRGEDGLYYLSVIVGNDACTAMLPPAKADELRIAMLPGFDPLRDDPNQIAVDREPPHPDD